MSGMNQGTGHCFCGAVSYAFSGPPNWQAHCHCESCRRNCSAPYTSFFGINHDRWRWTGTKPAVFASAPGVKRHFCATCGTPMAYENTRWSHEIHFYAASLTDPNVFKPDQQVHVDERLHWVAIDEDLPRRYSPRQMQPKEDFTALLALIQQSFAYMNGVVDPPSSATRLTVDLIADQARDGEIWVMEDLGQPIACMFLNSEPGQLYLGKMAVAEAQRGHGLSRQLIDHAKARADALGLPKIVLESRIELTKVHKAFRAMGFVQTAQTAHQGYDRPTMLTFTRLLN
ncbi:MAG: GNAT family N-acetyltransferase [Albidovulum sp.]